MEMGRAWESVVPYTAATSTWRRRGRS